jgi:hypothetical protein
MNESGKDWKKQVGAEEAKGGMVGIIIVSLRLAR